MVLKNHSHLAHPFAITLFGDFLYWTDWKSNHVVSVSIFFFLFQNILIFLSRCSDNIYYFFFFVVVIYKFEHNFYLVKTEVVHKMIIIFNALSLGEVFIFIFFTLKWNVAIWPSILYICIAHNLYITWFRIALSRHVHSVYRVTLAFLSHSFNSNTIYKHFTVVV